MRTILLFFALTLTACNSVGGDVPASENNLDAARNFINASLKGNWKEARKYLLADSTNLQLIDLAESARLKMPREERRGYNEASINLYDSRSVGDSVTIITYSNSFKQKKDSLRVVEVNNEWLVDLKYSFAMLDSAAYAQ